MQSDPVVIRLALVDDKTLFREGIRALVDGQPDLEVVAVAASVEACAEISAPPDIVVTSMTFGEPELAVAIERIRRCFAHVAVLVLTDRDDVESVQHVLAAGANGYLLKSATKTDFLAGVRAVARGGVYVQPSIDVALASHVPDRGAENSGRAVGSLTPKETEVLELLALGHTNSEIATRTGSSLRTIESHRAHILRRLDLRTRAQLVRFALDAGLLGHDDHPVARA